MRSIYPTHVADMLNYASVSATLQAIPASLAFFCVTFGGMAPEAYAPDWT